jgi:prevent-host-death family protein
MAMSEVESKMRTVNVATLKNNLSRYLRDVRRGEEILIRDRNVPIAKIVPLSSTDDSEAELLELAAQGLIKLGEGPLPDSFFDLPGPNISVDEIVAVIRAERDESY